MGRSSHTKSHILKYSLLQPQPLEREIIIIVKIYLDVRYQTDGPPNARKRSDLLFLLLLFFWLFKNLLFVRRFMLKNNIDHGHFILCPT